MQNRQFLWETSSRLPGQVRLNPIGLKVVSETNAGRNTVRSFEPEAVEVNYCR